MARHLAKIVCFGLGAVAGWQVWLQFRDVFPDPAWLKWAAGGLVLLIVFPAFYFPLFRPVFDLIGDRFSATNQRFRSNRMGVGLDEVPLDREDTATRVVVCAYCGTPGIAICEACREKIRR